VGEKKCPPRKRNDTQRPWRGNGGTPVLEGRKNLQLGGRRQLVQGEEVSSCRPKEERDVPVLGKEGGVGGRKKEVSSRKKIVAG